MNRVGKEEHYVLSQRLVTRVRVEYAVSGTKRVNSKKINIIKSTGFQSVPKM